MTANLGKPKSPTYKLHAGGGSLAQLKRRFQTICRLRDHYVRKQEAESTKQECG